MRCPGNWYRLTRSVGEYGGIASAEGYSVDGMPMNMSKKD